MADRIDIDRGLWNLNLEMVECGRDDFGDGEIAGPLVVYRNNIPGRERRAGVGKSIDNAAVFESVGRFGIDLIKFGPGARCQAISIAKARGPPLDPII